MIPERVLEFSNICFIKNKKYHINDRVVNIDFLFKEPVNIEDKPFPIDGIKFIGREKKDCDLKEYNDINMICALTDMHILFIRREEFSKLFH